MTYTEKAIRLAVEEDYKPTCWRDIEIDTAFVHFTTGKSLRSSWMLERVYCDPQFWRSLGRGLDWGTMPTSWYGSDNHDIPEWHYRWHRFVDWLAEGKTAEAFFSALLEEK